jgi:hypothetical protein
MLPMTRRQRVMGRSLRPSTTGYASSTFGDTVKRSVIASTAIALLLALGAAASAFAADPSGTITTSETPNPSGEISVDPTFETPRSTATPVSAVMGTKGRPERTPPPTDTVGAPSQAPGTGLQVLLLLAVASSSLVLIAGRLPVARRR